MVISLLSWSATTWAVGHARSFGYLACAQALMGISEACYMLAGLALIADYHGPRTRSLATGLHQSGIYIGVVVGGVGGGWLAQSYGWRHAFSVLGVAGLIYTPLLWAALKDPRQELAKADHPQVPQFFSSVRELMRLPGFPSMLLAFGGSSMGGWLIMTWLPLYLYERYHMSLVTAGFSATFFIQAAAVVGILVGGSLADLWSRRTSQGRILIQSIGLMMCVPFVFLVGATSSRIISAMSLVVYGFGRAWYDCNVMPVLCQTARPNLRATGYGLFNLSGTLLGGVTAGLAGILKSSLGIGGCVQVASMIFLFSSLVLFRLVMPRTQGPFYAKSPEGSLN